MLRSKNQHRKPRQVRPQDRRRWHSINSQFFSQFSPATSLFSLRKFGSSTKLESATQNPNTRRVDSIRNLANVLCIFNVYTMTDEEEYYNNPCLILNIDIISLTICVSDIFSWFLACSNWYRRLIYSWLATSRFYNFFFLGIFPSFSTTFSLP